MNIVISKKLESDIMNFVKLNEIDDVNNFLEVLSTKWHKRETEKSLEF